jgi:hypothetical protein
MASHSPRRRPDTPGVPTTTLHEITRRYYACAVALAKAMGLPLSETFLREHRESISCCFIEAGREGLRLPASVTLPPLVGKTEPEAGEGFPLDAQENLGGRPAKPDREAKVAEGSPNGHAPTPTRIPTAEGLPCGGALIVALQPAQLSMLIGKVETLAQAKGGPWATLLTALVAERQTRVAKGRKRPVLTPVPDPASDVP